MRQLSYEEQREISDLKLQIARWTLSPLEEDKAEYRILEIKSSTQWQIDQLGLC